MSTKIVCFTLLALLAFPPLVLAADYHVAASACASDANTGLSATCAGTAGPWKTLAHALKKLKPGDTLHLGAGVYPECGLSFAASGAKNAPIVLKADAPGKAILDGGGCAGKGNGILVDNGKGHFVFEGLVVRNMPGNGIATDENSAKPYEDITVRDCRLLKNGLSGLELAAVQGFVVQDVVAEGNGFYGLNIIGSKNGSLASGNGKVSRSRFADHTGREGHGLAINQGQKIEVRDCEATHNRVHGFDVSDWPKGGLVSSDVLFVNNRSHDNGKGGFAVNSDSSRVTYERNQAWNNGARWAGKELAPGFWCYEGCRDVVWKNNIAAGNSLAGFQVEDAAGEYDGRPATTNLTLSGNIAWDNGVAEWDEMWGLYVSKAGWKLTLANNNFGSSQGGAAKVVGLDMRDDKGRTFTAQDLNAGNLPGGNISRDPGFRNANKGDFGKR